jgi:hypothetical protein
VAHSLKRCTITGSGQASCGVVTCGIRVNFGENIGQLFTIISAIGGIIEDLALFHYHGQNDGV